MAYDVNKKVTAEDLETVLDRTREYVDGSIPETLPADGGNAETANKLTTPRTINGIAFDGSEDIEIDAVTAAELSDLKAYIGYTDSDIYGLEADFENNVFTRLAGAVGKNPGADFDSINAFGGRRRCNVYTNGAVVYDSTDVDGWDTTISDVNKRLFSVMVEQPKFYYKVIPLKIEKIDGADGYHLRKARYYISDTPKPGFRVHPAFIQNGVEVDKIYLSAFEGSIWSEDSGRIMEDEQIANFDADFLTSIANVKPASGTTQTLNRANARKLAQNRGAGWGITNIQTLSATQLLFAIEYATFNSQAAIGNGIVNTTETIKTGSTSSLGNVSGSVASGGISYRGEENPWGNIGKWVDGINVLNPLTWSTSQNPGNLSGTIFVADNNFADGIYDYPYQKTEIPSVYGDGYTSAFGYSTLFDWVFIPTEHSGNSAVPIGDALWNKNNVGRGVFIPAQNENNRSGLFALGFNYMPISHVSGIGARLIYIPQSETTAQEVTAND